LRPFFQVSPLDCGDFVGAIKSRSNRVPFRQVADMRVAFNHLRTHPSCHCLQGSIGSDSCRDSALPMNGASHATGIQHQRLSWPCATPSRMSGRVDWGKSHMVRPCPLVRPYAPSSRKTHAGIRSVPVWR
jgi:hypothetical protein